MGTNNPIKPRPPVAETMPSGRRSTRQEQATRLTTTNNAVPANEPAYRGLSTARVWFSGMWR